ncbi:hypothetical protein JW865_09325, partial [Candidatus Bathyarchaeota archaeon]|nr:hypothetical protein [Candidatus Bathyarchaeota archaeon]
YDYMILISSFDLVNASDFKGINLKAGIGNPEWLTLSNFGSYPYTFVGESTEYMATWSGYESLPIQEHYVFYHVKTPMIGSFSPEPYCRLEVCYEGKFHFLGSPTIEGGILEYVEDQGIKYVYYPQILAEKYHSINSSLCCSTPSLIA